jgi:hypothetical protein
MGIFDRLTTPAINEFKTFSPNGSIYAPNYVVNNSLPSSSLASLQSNLHAIDGDGVAEPGYSTGENGDVNREVFKQAQQYDDGHSDTLPNKSQLYLHKPRPTRYTSPTKDWVYVNYNSENTYLNSFKPGSK